MVINEAKPQFTQYELKTLTDDQIELLLQQKSINPNVEIALKRISSQKNVVAEYDGAQQQLSGALLGNMIQGLQMDVAL